MPDINEKALENELRSIVAEITEVEPEKITPDAKFIEDLGMDSMMALEILASIEKKYKLVKHLEVRRFQAGHYTGPPHRRKNDELQDVLPASAFLFARIV